MFEVITGKNRTCDGISRRDFVKVGGRPYQREPLDATWVLARFPA